MYVGRGGCPGGGTAATPGSGLAYQAPGGGERHLVEGVINE